MATLSTNPRINDQGALLTHLFDLASAFPRCGVVVAALALSQVSNLFSPVIMGKAIDILSLGSRGVRTLGILLLSLLGITVSAQFSNYIYKRQLAESMQAFEKNIRLRLWDGLAKISVGEYESMPRGSLHSKMNRDVSMLSMVIRIVLEAVFTSAIMGTWAIIWAAFRQPSILAVVAAAMAVNCLIYCLFRERISAATRKVQYVNEELHRVCYDMIEMIPLFRAFSVMPRYREYFGRNIDKNIRLNRKLNRSSQQFAAAIASVSEMGRYSVLVVALVMCLYHKISLGDVVLYQALFSQSLEGLSRIVFLMPDIEMGRESVNSIYSILSKSSQKSEANKEWVPVLEGEIRFAGVHFTYPGAASEALSGVSASIAQGEHVVIIGKNGSGKSTMARLLLGYYEPDRGDITIQGVSVTEAGSDAIAAQIAYVPQVSRIYRDTLLENIRLRNADIARKDIDEIARMCCLTRLVSRFANGLDEQITYSSLSGGETQCVAIARALARRPKAILLDEITSHLDIYSKKMVFNILRELHGVCTIITITHDVEFLELADRVLVMNEGKLYESFLDAPSPDMAEIFESIQPSSTKRSFNTII